MKITRKDIDAALAPSLWDFGNQVLYNLCQDHPRHKKEEEIIAKVWLIGRSYAAAIERGRENDEEITSDEFYETIVVENLCNTEDFSLDGLLDELSKRITDQSTDPWAKLGHAVIVHKKLMERFAQMPGLEKRSLRSLASKYLHFHRPDVFFLYDSRARMAVAKVTPSIKEITDSIEEITRMKAKEVDAEYWTFCRRCQWLRDDVSQRFDVRLTPRQVDKILLKIAAQPVRT